MNIIFLNVVFFVKDVLLQKFDCVFRACNSRIVTYDLEFLCGVILCF